MYTKGFLSIDNFIKSVKNRNKKMCTLKIDEDNYVLSAIDLEQNVSYEYHHCGLTNLQEVEDLLKENSLVLA